MKYPRDIFKHECLVLMCVNTVSFLKLNDSKQTRVVFCLVNGMYLVDIMNLLGSQ
jgi:hypothetical protein